MVIRAGTPRRGRDKLRSNCRIYLQMRETERFLGWYGNDLEKKNLISSIRTTLVRIHHIFVLYTLFISRVDAKRIIRIIKNVRIISRERVLHIPVGNSRARVWWAVISITRGLSCTL